MKRAAAVRIQLPRIPRLVALVAGNQQVGDDIRINDDDERPVQSRPAAIALSISSVVSRPPFSIIGGGNSTIVP